MQIVAVEPGGPAEKGNLLEEDVIIALADQTTANVDALHKLLTELPVGKPAPVVILRRNQRLERTVVPGEYPQRAI